MFFNFDGFSNESWWIMRSGGNNLSLTEENWMFRLEREFNSCRFVNLIMIGISDVFFEMGLDGSTCLSNVGFPSWTRNLVDAMG